MSFLGIMAVSFVSLLSDGSILLLLAPWLVYRSPWPSCIFSVHYSFSVVQLIHQQWKQRMPLKMLNVAPSSSDADTLRPRHPTSPIRTYRQTRARVSPLPRTRRFVQKADRRPFYLASLPTDYVHDFIFVRISSIQRLYVFSFHKSPLKTSTHTPFQTVSPMSSSDRGAQNPIDTNTQCWKHDWNKPLS